MKSRVFSTIRDVPKEHLAGLLARASCANSPEFWEVLEVSRLNDFQHRFALFYDDQDRPVAFTSFYTVTTDVAIFAPPWLRRILTAVRRIFPGFLKLRMLECGTPITVSSPPILTSLDQPVQEVVPAVSHLLMRTTRAEGQFFIVIRDFEPNAAALRPDLQALGYHWVDSLPNTYLDIRWSSTAQYLASLKSYYRSKLFRHLRKNEARSVRHELVEDFAPLAETLCAQWLVVHDHAREFQREVLTPAFYRELSARMGRRSKALLFHRGGDLVGHALLLVDGDLLRWLYFGRRDAANDSLYIYVVYAVIATAIELGAKRLEMGLTTYPVKQDLGAEAVPNKIAVRSPNPLINALTGLVYPLLNHVPPIPPKDVFKRPERP